MRSDERLPCQRRQRRAELGVERLKLGGKLLEVLVELFRVQGPDVSEVVLRAARRSRLLDDSTRSNSTGKAVLRLRSSRAVGGRARLTERPSYGQGAATVLAVPKLFAPSPFSTPPDV